MDADEDGINARVGGCVHTSTLVAEEGAAPPQAVQPSCPEEDDDDDAESVAGAAGAAGAANGRPTAQRAGRGEP